MGGLCTSWIEIPVGAKGVIVGIDLGWKWDTTAFVPIRRVAEEEVDHGVIKFEVNRPAILTPPQDGSSLDSEEVFGVAAAMAERWPGCTFVCDPEAGGEQLAQRIDRELDATVLTHSQKPGPMGEASQLLAEAIAERASPTPTTRSLRATSSPRRRSSTASGGGS
jgi:hypothetical protein